MFARRLAAGLTALGLALTACTGGGAAPGGGQAITVQGTDYKFDAADVTVKANQPVQIAFRNTSGQVHDWTVQGLDQNVVALAQPGQTANVQFTPTKTGTFKVVCAQPGHEQLGMVGQLIVQ